MNVFVLNTGRCGSVTFAKACSHITNFGSGHETRCALVGKSRLAYPDNHIEVDNRLSWLLGRLDKKYGDTAFYVHLVRESEGAARSYNRRWRNRNGIASAYAHGILMQQEESLAVAADLIDTVQENIRMFLEHHTHVLTVRLETIKDDFVRFWDAIGAQGDQAAALKEFDRINNASAPVSPRKSSPRLRTSDTNEEPNSQADYDYTSYTYRSPLQTVSLQTQNGALRAILPKEELFRVNEIFSEQGYSILKRRSHAGPLVAVDVGANVGLFALYLQILDPQSQLFCYEPVASTYALLCKNSEPHPRIQAYPYGLFDSDTTAAITINGTNRGQNSPKLTSGEGVATEEILLRDAGSEFDRRGLTHCDVLKIDTEGCEVEILRSLGDRLDRIDYVLVEYHSEADRRSIDSLLEQFVLFGSRPDTLGSGTAKYVHTRLVA